MDGSMHRFLHRGHDLLSPQQLTLDRINRRIYFTDPQQNCIFELDYDGGRRFFSVLFRSGTDLISILILFLFFLLGRPCQKSVYTPSLQIGSGRNFAICSSRK